VRPPLLALVGPTGSGKTEASLAVAQALGAEILCVDSMTVYRGLDAATAKPTERQRSIVPHHLLDLVEIDQPYSVAEFQRAAREVIDDVRLRGRQPLLVGGSGLYFRAVVDGLQFPTTDPATRGELEAEARALGPSALYQRLSEFDPDAARRIQPANARRTIRALEVSAITGRRFSEFASEWERFDEGAVRAAGIRLPRETLRRRIEDRARELVPMILVETRRLMTEQPRWSMGSAAAIGYAEAAMCLEGRLSPEDLERTIVRQQTALARRQMAWFRRDPRIRWFDAGEGGANEVATEVARYLGEVVPERSASATMDDDIDRSPIGAEA
jgi:tRNA dimethylallyltransferase